MDEQPIAAVASSAESVSLVGRDGERAALRHHLAAARAGRGGVVLIGGEAGVGKTTLAVALASDAAAVGVLTVVGRCYDHAETPPYSPWFDLFAQCPPVENALPFGPGAVMQEVTSHVALFARAKGFLAAVAARQPLVLLLEDFHWADPASLDMLRFLARALPTLPVLALVTYRADELGPEHPLFSLIPLLVREANAARINLRRLDNDAIESLVRARYALSETDTARLAGYLATRTSGNPLFMDELLRALEEGGTLAQAGAGWRLGAFAQAGVPALLQQVITGRLSRLDEEVRLLLSLAAVIGQEVPLDLWATLGRVDELTLLDAIEPAIAARVVEETPDGTRARFVHALIRDALYEGMRASRRRLLHVRVGEALAASRQPDPDAVAYHFRQAEDARATPWLVQAAERAEQSLAFPSAAERYAAALSLLPNDDSHAERRGWLLHGLARTLRYIRPREGITHLDAALRAADVSGDAALRAMTLRLRGLLRCYTGEVRRGLEDMEGAVAAHAALAAPARATLHTRLGWTNWGTGDGYGTLVAWLSLTGRCTEARERGERLIAGMDTDAPGNLGNPDARNDPGDGIAYSGLAQVYGMLGLPDAARQSFRRYREVNEALGDYAQIYSSLSYEAMLVHLPYAAERRRLAAEMEQIGARAHSTLLRPPRYMLLALLFTGGAWDEIDAIIEAAHTLGTATNVHMGWAFVRGPLARARGDTAGAWAVVHAAFPDGPTAQPGAVSFADVAPVLLLAAALAGDAGDTDTARRWLDAHDRWFAWSGATLGLAEGALAWAEHAHRTGDRETARARAACALSHAEEPRQPLSPCSPRTACRGS